MFDNSRNVVGYGGVRLSYVPGEIADIGREYRPALVALQTRRDANEKLLLAGKADFDVVHETRALNDYLDEPERNVALFDRMKTMGPAYAKARGDMLRMIWQQLVEAKRYDEVKDDIDVLAKRVAGQVAESAINNDFPDEGERSSAMYQNYLRRSVIDDGGKVYEALLGLGRKERADKLAKWMLTLSSDGEMYAQLINSSLDADRHDIAAELIERATRTLKGPEDLRLVREAAKRLPAAN